ncbi:hypothetical protein EES43_27530 [Streptomyces sp. ADI96-02]|uniref:DUF6529 family protein n=1 Tax=unclassified Streptomyces TaxID=2593676 RepID=UPI000F54C901|nr:DUF6529 family protein [Streptomyces sp. ADI96-02]RPK55084.1 hypothetical protein EES43_27530 [Streptomyces sp. ADI96-02]
MLALLGVLLPVAVGVGIYFFGTHHTPDYDSGLYGEHGAAAVDLKARLGSALLCLALIQLVLALWMYGRVPGARSAPRSVRLGHRVLGFLTFLFSLPIAYHCLETYGIETTSPRTAIHSFAGCALYGAFVAKVIVVRSRRLPGWMLPVMGSLLVLGVALLWYTAALWVLNGDSVPGFSES